MNVEFHPLADRELTEAAQFYEARASGLGGRFLDHAERALRLLAVHPELGRPMSASTRSFPVRPFPYSFVYRFISGGLQVLAVAHQRRRPLYWAGRDR
jgi:plasmid stabilization system protein ParE